METVYVGCVELIVSMFPMAIIFSTMFTLICYGDNPTFRGRIFGRTIAKPSDCHFEKMTLGDL